MKKFKLLIFTILSIPCIAQNNTIGTWNILNLKYNINKEVSIFGEGQIRSLKFYNNYHYYEYKGGINCKLHNYVTISLGTGSYQTFNKEGNFMLPKNNNEFRIWPQLILNQSIGKLKIEQRYRTELRFTSNGYRNRYRYRFGLIYTFGNQNKGYQRFQLNASNELFFTDKEPYFERNRILFSLNYKTTKNTTLQIGYLHQFDYKINDETGTDFIQIGCYIELFNKSNKEESQNQPIND